MEMLKSYLDMSPTAIEAFKLLEAKREAARKRHAEYAAGAEQRIAAAEAKRARKRAKNLALAAR